MVEIINGCTSLSMSITIPGMDKIHHNDATYIENLMASFFFGMIFGSMILGLITYRLGRKNVLLFSNFVHIGSLVA